jgi:integrase
MPRIDLKQALATRKTVAHVAADMSFSELVSAYAHTCFDGTDLMLRKWVKLFEGRSAWSITPAEIDAGLRAMLDAGYAPATVNRNASHLGSIFKWAKVKRRIAPPGFVSPTIGLERFEEPVRVVSITPAQIEALLAASLAYRDRRFGALIYLLHDSGARRGEVLLRRWADVDLDKRQILVERTKTARARVLHFSAATAALLERVYPATSRRPEAMVFEGKVPGQPKSFRREWVTLAKSVGRADLHMHDLRHHRAAEMLKAGRSVAQAAQVLGHSSLILQRRYGHLETGHLQETIEASW